MKEKYESNHAVKQLPLKSYDINRSEVKQMRESSCRDCLF